MLKVIHNPKNVEVVIVRDTTTNSTHQIVIGTDIDGYCSDEIQFGYSDYGNDKKTFFRLTLPEDENIQYMPKFDKDGRLITIECLIETYDSNCYLGNLLQELGGYLIEM